MAFQRFKNFCSSTDGATAIEYAMIMAMVFLAIIGSMQALGASIVDVLYNKIGTALQK